MAVQFFASTTELVQWRGGFWASPNNLPLPRPGLYLIQHFMSGKCYVGISHNLQQRLAAWAVPSCRMSTKMRNALRKYGPQEFVMIPAYYSISNESKKELPHVEAALIAELNSVGNGYNTKEKDGGVGPYGPAFSEIIRAANARPEVRAKLSTSGRVAMARPEVIARISAACKAAQNTPEVKARVLAGVRAAHADPEVKAKHRTAMSVVASRRLEKMRTAGLTYGGLPIQPSLPKLTKSEASRLSWKNPETRARRIAALLGKPRSPETIAKMKATVLAKKTS